MSNPVICNRSPAPLTIDRPLAPVRFGLRSNTTQVVLADTNMYLGYGKAYYEPVDVVPELMDSPIFNLDVLFGDPDGDVSRQVALGWLRIEKSGVPADNLRGTYFFGRLEAPMRPDGPLMLEFRLKLNAADITPVPVGVQFTGIVFGVFINDCGFIIRFYHDNLGNRWIEVFDGNQNSTQRVNPLAPTYRYDFDWDGVDNTYKVLWDPRMDRMWVLLSSGQDSLAEDTVIINGLVSDFPTIPSDQIRENQPVAFFGHAYPGTNSISYWGGAYLYSETTIGMLNGLYQGEHEGFIRNNHVVSLDMTEKPRDNGQAWSLFPTSYGSIGGEEKIVAEELILSRTDKTKSFGFYRIEPAVASGITIIDFAVRGEILERSSSSDQVSGFEVFIDSGSKAVRIGFADNAVSKKIGILGTGFANLFGSYTGPSLDWSEVYYLRLVFDPTYSAKLYQFEESVEAIGYTPVGEVFIAGLPASALPNPAVGFFHNALACSVLADMIVSLLRYMVGAVFYESAGGLPTAPWTKVGTGPTTIEDETLVIEDDSFSAITRYRTTEATFDISDGAAVDFLMKIEQYEDDTGINPARQNTGVAVVIDDGTFRTALVFADGGPELGKIAYIASANSYEESLFRVRAGDARTEDTFCSVDWTLYHLYRLERDSNGGVRLFIDNAGTAVINILAGTFVFPPTEDGQKKIAFGSILDDLKNISHWRHVIRSISAGYDLSVAQKLNTLEQEERYGKAANVIVSADI